ncbi:hypothetical protein Syn7502_01280 [Synechococcus sp. PCC 7502]|uniref:hypothetical protein n=1 Tax=Synechococcus sp. PCC 7502 TaxID=1173263 RepID=UPI00029FE691|nr:hypothetical protein [Synechococcus sp. PCC 7502]AFY73374.1 hypothetical protein Syn7502_01280 [Synechococcus sp. PCC 7502]
MAYSDFTLMRLKEELGLIVKEEESLFDHVLPVPPSLHLKESLKQSQAFVTLVNTEKVRSEFLIAPILGEVKAQLKPTTSLFSGTKFNVDPAMGRRYSRCV